MAWSVLALVGSSLVWSPAGRADSDRHREEVVLCTGSSDSTYDPPLTLASRETHISVNARYTCSVAPGRNVTATGALDGVSPSASCLTLGSTARLTETVQYDDGKRSLIAYDGGGTYRIAGVQILRLTGRVVEGRGKGQQAQRTVSAASDALPTECLSSGLPGSSGRAQLEIRP
ncbi:hypothetical protein GO001_09825 [Streptomyces sp. NRRL B-1677]|uniref:hypothetical protein n=1 Tax=Streptomyces sp. NRRL B-1677 TaxID=2682966 RepID=UPI0018929061|nr:hypothetical protein [Streptomyces sp. NRRL B-1677]MBF6045517.1 hypothetical protein [Streptomyces sp. NRRL B-1677]